MKLSSVMSDTSASFVVRGGARRKQVPTTTAISSSSPSPVVPVLLRKSNVQDSVGLIFEIPSTKESTSKNAGAKAILSSCGAQTPSSDTATRLNSNSNSNSNESNNNESDANNSNNSSNQAPSSSVDSALLSALRDPRERVALLRLEQTLSDFMNDVNCGFMEVGGPFNSVVVRGEGGNISSDVIPKDSNTKGETIQQNRVVEGRQTSFQRLCLHRLADRFNIAREASLSSSTFEPAASGNINAKTGGTGYSPGLIRLIKTKNSCAPTFLLIDMDLSIYTDNNNSHPTTTGGGRTKVTNNAELSSSSSSAEQNNLPDPNNPTPSQNTKSISDRLYGMNLMTKEKNPGTNKNGKNKIKIMKRNSSGSLNNSGNGDSSSPSNGCANNSNRLKGKNLSDREKAYAEARARIFNTQLSSSLNEEGKDTTEPVNHTSSTYTPSIQNIPPIDHVVPDYSVSIQTSSTNVGVENNASPHSSASFALPMQVPSKGDEYIQNHNTNSYKAASKVTWRNRKQEESDPDFRRSRRPMVIPMPMNAAALPPMVATGYGAQHGMVMPHLSSGMGIVPSHHPMTHHGYASHHHGNALVNTASSTAPPPVEDLSNSGYNPIALQQQQQQQQQQSYMLNNTKGCVGGRTNGSNFHTHTHQHQVPIHPPRYAAPPNKGLSVASNPWNWPEQNEPLNFSPTPRYKTEPKYEQKKPNPPVIQNNITNIVDSSKAQPLDRAQDHQPELPNHVSILPAPQAPSSSNSDAATSGKGKALMSRQNGCPWGQQPTNSKTPVSIISDLQVKNNNGTLIYNAEEFPSLE